MKMKKLTIGLLLILLSVGILVVGLKVSPVSAAPVVDGIISPGEYDGGMVVQLTGPYPPGAPFPPWITDAYIWWDTEYLYVAVDEPVPASTGSGLSSWIEFQFDVGPAYHSFVLFADGTPQHVLYPLPSGPWYWDVPPGFNNPYPWYAATNTATEFQVKYTDFGIAYGHMLKMSIDRGKDDFTNPPLGECSVWPNPCIFYPTADASTWGDVHLSTLGPPTQYSLTVNSVPISGISYTVDSQSALTGTSITLNNGSHTIIMPSTVTSGSDSYQFTLWENSLTSPVRTINLQSDTVLSATYSNHTVDGVISPSEYDSGLAVQLIGRTDPNWTVNGYIAWDNEYLYVAVNESVPPGTGIQSWIEFCFDAGPSRSYLDAFVLFCSGQRQYVQCPKPPGSWGWKTYDFLSATNTATEFRVKYTDFGIVPGDTIKLAIDRNLGPPPPAPYGFAAFWPQGAVVYYDPPDPTTWGTVTLAPSEPVTYEFTVNSVPVSGISYTVDSQPAVTGTPIILESGSHTIMMPSLITIGADAYNFARWEDNSTNPARTLNLQSNAVLTATYTKAGPIVDGTISPGEYDGGMAVQLVGRWNPNWTVNGYIAWDAEYLYVAVNEPVPNTTGHKSWIEFAIDAGPARPYLDAFVFFDDHAKVYDRYVKPLGLWVGVGPGNFSAVSDVATEFKVKYTDYQIMRGDTIKMSVDRNLGPAPPSPYGFAAFWPQNATVYDGVPIQAVPATWGNVTLAVHNVAVTDITPFKTVIGQGYAGNMSVTTANSGDYGESFNTVAYANQTIIAAFMNTTLASGNSTILTLTWNTTTASYGTYEISAIAGQVPGETDIADNNYTCPVLVHVGVPGDISGPTQGAYDGTCNMRDITYAILLFNTNPSSPNWKPNADINNDGTVNMRDIQIQILNFNKHE
jgi:hypothetical protein